MKRRLPEIAKVIRSKNAGPYELTLDILIRDRAIYERLRDRKRITADKIAALYRLPVDRILDVIYFDPAKAVKITMLRRCPSGVPGETDVYGAQQHAPLLDLEVEVD